MGGETRPSALGTILVGDILELAEVQLYEHAGNDLKPLCLSGQPRWKPEGVVWAGGPLRLERVASGNVLLQRGRFPSLARFEISGKASSIFRLPGRFEICEHSILFHSDTGWACVLAASPGCRAEFQILSPTSGQFFFQGSSSEFIFAVAADNQAERAAALAQFALEQPEKIFDQARRNWQSFLEEEMPPYPLEDEKWKNLYETCWCVLWSNRTAYGHPPLSSPFTSPSKFTYRHQWLWDSVFAAVGLRWLKNKKWATGELENILAHPCPDGMLPHEIFHHPLPRKHFWPQGDGCSSTCAAPPILGIGLEKIFEMTGDRPWLERAFPVLQRSVEWYLQTLDGDKDQLVSLRHTHESCWDNSPRWDSAMREGRRLIPVETVDTNSFLACDLQRLARWARFFGNASLAAELEQRGRRMADAIRNTLWDPDTGFFYDADEKTHEKARLKTPAAFLTLWGGIASPEQEEALVGHLTRPDEFWTPYPLPVVARNESAYSPRDMWRGPTWLNINWLVIEGLRQRGRFTLARELAVRTLDAMVSQGEPAVREWYHPETGEPMGALNYGWSAAVAIDLLMDVLAPGRGQGRKGTNDSAPDRC